MSFDTLKMIEAQDVPSILVLNKYDKAESADILMRVAASYPNAIPVSAHTGYGLETLRSIIVEELEKCFPLWQRPSAISET